MCTLDLPVLFVLSLVDTKVLLSFVTLSEYAKIVEKSVTLFPFGSHCGFEWDVAVNVSATSPNGKLLGVVGNCDTMMSRCKELLDGAHMAFPKLGVDSIGGHSSQAKFAKTDKSLVRAKSYPAFLERLSRDKYGRSVFAEAPTLVRLCSVSSEIAPLLRTRRVDLEKVILFFFFFCVGIPLWGVRGSGSDSTQFVNSTERGPGRTLARQSRKGSN